MTQPDTSAIVSEAEQEFFHREGYLVLPGLIDTAFNNRLIAELDELVGHRQAKEH